MERIIRLLARLVRKSPWSVVFASLIVTAVLGSFISQQETTQGNEGFAPDAPGPSHPRSTPLGRVSLGARCADVLRLRGLGCAGAVRELAERVRQAVRIAGSGAISAESLLLGRESDDIPSFKDAKRAFETRYVEGLLRRCNGNISRAARLAKKDRKDFYDVIRRTGVDPTEFRS